MNQNSSSSSLSLRYQSPNPKPRDPFYSSTFSVPTSTSISSLGFFSLLPIAALESRPFSSNYKVKLFFFASAIELHLVSFPFLFVLKEIWELSWFLSMILILPGGVLIILIFPHFLDCIFVIIWKTWKITKEFLGHSILTSNN